MNKKERHDWEKEWKNMPEFIQENKKPLQQIKVSFESWEDVEEFAEITGAKLTPKTKSMWYPFRPLKKNTQGYATEE